MAEMSECPEFGWPDDKNPAALMVIPEATRAINEETELGRAMAKFAPRKI